MAITTDRRMMFRPAFMMHGDDLAIADRQPSTAYRAVPSAWWAGHTAIKDAEGDTVDILRVRSVAEYMTEKLNAGQATIHPHATLGCRIEVL